MFRRARLSSLALLFLSSSASASQSACISMQGNGPRFLALIGEAVALLESDVHPEVITGGSSAALTIPIIQATLANPSLQKTVVLNPDGTPLSAAQKAALVLSGIAAPGETLLFLPSLNRFGQTLADVAQFVASSMIAHAFPSDPESHMASMEAVSGQGLLFIDFFASSDFSDVLELASTGQRNRLLMEKWRKFADLMLVTPEEFIRALVTAPKSARATPRTEEIKRRYFGIFRTENSRPEESPEASLRRYNEALQKVSFAVDRIPDKPLVDAYHLALRGLREVPWVGFVTYTAARPFYLPNPEKIWNAYQGFSISGKRMTLPPGALMHTTARLADISSDGKMSQKSGTDNFFQLYFPSDDLYDDLREARASLTAERGFIEFPHQDAWRSVVPVERTLVLHPRPLHVVARTSISEPGAFMRSVIPLNEREHREHALSWSLRQSLVTYGGWMAHVESHTLARIPRCRQADFIVDISTLTPDLRKFQEYAARPIFEHGWISVGRNLGWLLGYRPVDPVQAWLDGLWKSYEFSRSISGTAGHITLPFNWDNASGLTGPEARAANALYDATTSAYFLRAYQDAAFRLREIPTLQGREGLPMLRSRLTRYDLRNATTAEEMRRMTEALLEDL